VIVVLSFLMVSNIPIMSLKFKGSTVRNNAPKIIIAILAIAAALTLKWVAIPVILLAYVIVSLAFKKIIA
jgi:CDP-diacylglycerol--serine O-phosphatidyltransferase